MQRVPHDVCREGEPLADPSVVQHVVDAASKGDDELAAERPPELGGIEPERQTVEHAGGLGQAGMSVSRAHGYPPEGFASSRRLRAAFTAVSRRFASALTTRVPKGLMR